MIKVCFLVSSLCNEGPVNVMYNIIQYMDFDRFDVSIITLIPEKANSRLDDFRRLPVSIHLLFPDRMPSPVAMFREAYRCLKSVAPDMVHAHCPRSLYILYLLRKKFLTVYTVHIYPGRQQRVLYGEFKGRLVVFLNNFATRHLSLAIGCAESVGELYLQHEGWSIPCIPNGCSLPLWPRDADERLRLRRKLGLRDDVRYFIFIGRFSAEKKPAFLVEAFRRFPREDVGIVMLGDGPLLEGLRPYASDRILMPGFQSNVYDYLIAADFYISASEVEGLANTLLESMTVGLPMLLSDIPSHREVLRRIPQTVAFIYDNTDRDDLYRCAEQLLALDYRKASDAIRQTFSDFYTARRMSLDYQKTYVELYSQYHKH